MRQGLSSLFGDLARALRGIAELHPAALTGSCWSDHRPPRCETFRPTERAPARPAEPVGRPAARSRVAYHGRSAKEQL